VLPPGEWISFAYDIMSRAMLPFAKLLWSLFTFFVGKQQIKIENEFEVQFGKKIFKE